MLGTYSFALAAADAHGSLAVAVSFNETVVEEVRSDVQSIAKPFYIKVS